MGSLMELLFDTMPFAGAAGALLLKTGQKLGDNSLSDACGYIEHVPWESVVDKLQYKSSEAVGPAGEESSKTKAATQLAEQVGNVPPDQWESTTKEDRRRSRSIWGYAANRSSDEVHGITCRVAGDGFKRYTVLNQLFYGNDYDGTFKDSINVRTANFQTQLRLNDEACLANFLVTNGVQHKNNHWLWPLAARHDRALLRVFVYDVDGFSGKVTPLTLLPEGHPDQPDLKKFREACKALEGHSPSTKPISLVLFQDRLWRHAQPTPLVAPVVPMLPGMGPAMVAASAAIQVQAASMRIVVCCALTLHKEDDTYTPGRPAWAVRLSPHIMVRSSQPLVEIAAGLKFHRPSATDIEGGDACGCGEMNKEMSSLLVSDTNKGNFVYDAVAGLPQPFWNNLFNYYVPDPANHPELKKLGKLKVVDRTRIGPRLAIDGAILRQGDPIGRVTRFPRQGLFDNVHVAPTMKMPPVEAAERVFGSRIMVSDRDAWHLDKIWMAPICAHDCFHMHWRWTDSVFTTDTSVYGWKAGQPCAKAGEVMIPENQDLFIRFLSPAIFSYFAQAFEVKADEWQVFCHHGAAYVVEVKASVDRARIGTDVPVLMTGGTVAFSEGLPPTLYTGSNWAVWYWNHRYYLDGAAPAERVRIIDMSHLVTESPRPGNK